MPDRSDLVSWLEDSMRQPSGTRTDFQAQLVACDRLLVGATRHLGSQIVPVTAAFLEADEHAAREAMSADVELDERCRELEEACYVLIARQAPVAGDLRRLVAILRSVADVERSGALLRHVAKALEWVHPPALPEDIRGTIAELGTVSSEITVAAADAWERHDALAASDLESRDDEVDMLQKWVLTEVYTGGQSVEDAVSLALLSRYYERIADHGVEIARQLAYFLTGERFGEDTNVSHGD